MAACPGQQDKLQFTSMSDQTHMNETNRMTYQMKTSKEFNTKVYFFATMELSLH